jgi:hypothetical protein
MTGLCVRDPSARAASRTGALTGVARAGASRRRSRRRVPVSRSTTGAARCPSPTWVASTGRSVVAGAGTAVPSLTSAGPWAGLTARMVRDMRVLLQFGAAENRSSMGEHEADVRWGVGSGGDFGFTAPGRSDAGWAIGYALG